MKTIGLLAGFGTGATTVFENQILEESRRLLPPHANQGFPPMVTVHLRHAPVLPLEPGHTSRPRIDPRVLDAAARLGSWADFLVIVANTPHLFVAEIAEAAGCEVVSMIDLVVAELERRGVRGNDAPVGLLGLGVPLAYAERFEREGISRLDLPEDLRAPLDDAIFRTIELRTTEDHRESARRAVDFLRAAGAEPIVLGCTEIPLLLGGADAPDLIDPGRLLARAAVRKAIGLDG